MTREEILRLRDTAEQTRVQFKERVTRDNKYDVSCEMVAQSNYQGGKIVVGIDDKTGRVNPLSYQEVQETTNLLGSLASEGVVPQVLLDIETVTVEDGNVVVATVKEGLNKPYHDSKGIVWVKQGADKRKVFDNAELAEMMSQCGSFAPDEAAVNDFTITDMDEQVLKKYLLNRFSVAMERSGVNETNLRDYTLEQMAHFVVGGISLEGLLRNLRFMRPDGRMTVAAVLLFGKYPPAVAACLYGEVHQLCWEFCGRNYFPRQGERRRHGRLPTSSVRYNHEFLYEESTDCSGREGIQFTGKVGVAIRCIGRVYR